MARLNLPDVGSPVIEEPDYTAKLRDPLFQILGKIFSGYASTTTQPTPEEEKQRLWDELNSSEKSRINKFFDGLKETSPLDRQSYLDEKLPLYSPREQKVINDILSTPFWQNILTSWERIIGPKAQIETPKDYGTIEPVPSTITPEYTPLEEEVEKYTPPSLEKLGLTGTSRSKATSEIEKLREIEDEEERRRVWESDRPLFTQKEQQFIRSVVFPPPLLTPVAGVESYPEKEIATPKVEVEGGLSPRKKEIPPIAIYGSKKKFPYETPTDITWKFLKELENMDLSDVSFTAGEREDMHMVISELFNVKNRDEQTSRFLDIIPEFTREELAYIWQTLQNPAMRALFRTKEERKKKKGWLW